MHKGLSKKNTDVHIAVEVIGWYGVVAIIGAYFFLSFGLLAADTVAYQVINATGALAIIIHSVAKKDFQPLVLNIIWIVIALIGIFQAL